MTCIYVNKYVYIYIDIYLYKKLHMIPKNRPHCIIAKLWGQQLSTSAKSFFGLYLVISLAIGVLIPMVSSIPTSKDTIQFTEGYIKASKLMILQGGKSGQGPSCAYTVDSLLPTGFCFTCTYNGGVGWGGADDVQVSSKTDLRIHKTKRWGGGVVLISLRPVNWKV